MNASWGRLRSALVSRAREDGPGAWLSSHLLSAIYSSAASISMRAPTRVFFRNGQWEHLTSTGETLIDLEPTRTPGVQANMAIKLFTHRYVPAVGDIVVDVGSGVGSELPYFSSKVGHEGRVIAVEANPMIWACAAQTVTRNRLWNTDVLNVAVGREPDQLQLHVDQSSHQSATFAPALSENQGHVRSTVEFPVVPVDRLTDLLLGLGIESVDFLKINIEGWEHDALLGLDCSRIPVRNICVSCHDFLRNPAMMTLSRVTSWLEENDFKVERHPPVSGQPWAEYYVYGSAMDS